MVTNTDMHVDIMLASYYPAFGNQGEADIILLRALPL